MKMNGSQDCPVYMRQKWVTVAFDGVTRDYILTAPSVKDMEEARKEAQRLQAEMIKRLPELAESLRAVFLLQETAVLIEAALIAESDEITRKAGLTLVEGDPEYEQKLAAKAETLKDTRRSELGILGKEQLADKLIGAETNRQLAAAWHCAVMNATLARVLVDGEGRRIFASVDELQAALPVEVLYRFYEAMNDFLLERGDAKVFPKPHISKG